VLGKLQLARLEDSLSAECVLPPPPLPPPPPSFAVPASPTPLEDADAYPASRARLLGTATRKLDDLTARLGAVCL
jgi:hypothetical protein